MENKYYTPNIEDIRVGYECEVQIKGEWRKEIISKSFGIIRHEPLNDQVIQYPIIYLIDTLNIRTPYLTKEQIEAEGWAYNKSFNIYHKEIDSESGWSLTHKDNSIMIAHSGECWFYGECPSINEFRYITKKLLKIN